MLIVSQSTRKDTAARSCVRNSTMFYSVLQSTWSLVQRSLAGWLAVRRRGHDAAAVDEVPWAKECTGVDSAGPRVASDAVG